MGLRLAPTDAQTPARDLGLAVLEQAGIELGGPQPWDLHVNDERLWRRVLREPALGLGESYQDGWWDAAAVDQFLVKLLTSDLRAVLRRSPRLVALSAGSTAINRQTRRRASHNASAHYDIGNDLFERMLDPLMVYSCAFWQEADDLAAAQRAKLELICQKLALEPGMRLLDIGCGWGALAAWAAEHHGATVVGITPAGEQVGPARARTAGLAVEILQADYREVTGRFDRIVSVGMMEHVGARNLRTFFERCRHLLTDDGLMLHHTIGSNESKNRTDPWFDRYIFPGGVVPSLGQIARAAEHDWAVEDVHNLGPDYDRTLMAWHENVEVAWADLPAYDERFRRTWRYYLMASAASFRVRNLQLYQVVFRRSRRPSGVYRAVRAVRAIPPS